MHTYEQSTAAAVSASVSTMNACHIYFGIRVVLWEICLNESSCTLPGVSPIDIVKLHFPKLHYLTSDGPLLRL